MGHFRITESERNEILGLHNKARLINEQAAPSQTDKDKIIKVQQILKTKYNANLGTLGPNKDGIDGVLGPKTLSALNTAIASKTKAPANTAGQPAGGTTPPTAGGTTPPTAGGTTPPTAGGTTPPTGAVVSGTTGTSGTVGTSGTSGGVMTTGEKVSDVTGPVKQASDVLDDGQPQLNQGSQQALAGNLTPQQIRQQARFDQRLARQARRTARRAGEQGQQ